MVVELVWLKRFRRSIHPLFSLPCPARLGKHAPVAAAGPPSRTCRASLQSGAPCSSSVSLLALRPVVRAGAAGISHHKPSSFAPAELAATPSLVPGDFLLLSLSRPLSDLGTYLLDLNHGPWESPRKRDWSWGLHRRRARTRTFPSTAPRSCPQPALSPRSLQPSQRPVGKAACTLGRLPWSYPWPGCSPMCFLLTL